MVDYLFWTLIIRECGIKGEAYKRRLLEKEKFKVSEVFLCFGCHIRKYTKVLYIWVRNVPQKTFSVMIFAQTRPFVRQDKHMAHPYRVSMNVNRILHRTQNASTSTYKNIFGCTLHFTLFLPQLFSNVQTTDTIVYGKRSQCVQE